VAGDLCRTSFHNLIGGFDTRTGREWVHYEWSGGGNGAFAEGDGPSAMATIDWGDLVVVQPSEVIESRMPLIVESSQLATDSGGAGTTRGGLAMQRRIRLTAPEARYSLLSDGAILPAFGVLAGRSGLPVASWVELANGRIEDFDTPGKVGGHLLTDGDRVVLRSAGGGGYGDPLHRDPESVADDLRLGYISKKVAAQIYGLAMTANGTVDAAATQAARTKVRNARHLLRTITAEDTYRESVTSRHRICRLNPDDAKRLGFSSGDIAEVDAYRAAPFRAWIELDSETATGTLPVDAKGLRMLMVEAGEPVEIRMLRRANADPRSGVLWS